MKIRRVSTALALAVVGGVSLAGCSPTVDSEEIEDQIGQELEEQTGVAPETVDCPDDIDATAGASLRCTVTAPDGTQIGVTVTVTGVEGTTVNYDFEVDDEPIS